jgi:hypothetical protein
MQEGSLSLMQKAKISYALYDFQINQKLFYLMRFEFCTAVLLKLSMFCVSCYSDCLIVIGLMRHDASL